MTCVHAKEVRHHHVSALCSAGGLFSKCVGHICAVTGLRRALQPSPRLSQHSTDNDSLSSYGASLTLGGWGETPLQMATGASVLAAQGVLHPPSYVTDELVSRYGTQVTFWAAFELSPPLTGP